MANLLKTLRVFLALAVFLPALPVASHASGSIEGTWEGTMGSNSERLRVAFVLKKGLGEYHNIDDGIHGEPLTVRWRKGGLQAQTAGGGKLELLKSPDGKTLTGTFQQGPGKDYQLSLTAARKGFAVTLRQGGDFLVPRPPAEGPARPAYHYDPPKELPDGWESGDLRKGKTDLTPLESTVRKIGDGRYPYIHSLLLVKGGRLVLEEYFYGYGPQDRHPIQSITKNVFSLLFGIAEGQGLCAPSQKLYDYFPDYRAKPGWDSRKDQITLGMLLTMTSGLGCDDLQDSKDCSWAMVQSPDWLDFSLSLPQGAEPGSKFTYCGACLTPLAAVLEKRSGKTLPDFAQQYLFDPLGIARPPWWEGPAGAPVPAFGLFLSSRDMAKLGYLVMRKGKWKGREVVPESWIAQSTSPLVPNTQTGKEADYGYLWWERDVTYHGKKSRSLDAWGVGGQHIFIVPDLDLVCVLTGGNYKDGTLANNSFKIFHEVLEALP